MRPVDQTKFPPMHGNCLQACIASILELPLDDVPDFVGDSAEGWFPQMQQWLTEKYGLGTMLLQFDGARHFTSPVGWYLATGPDSSGCRHTVVCNEDRIAHDPHPERGGLTAVEQFLVFTLRDPARLAGSADACGHE